MFNEDFEHNHAPAGLGRRPLGCPNGRLQSAQPDCPAPMSSRRPSRKTSASKSCSPSARRLATPTTCAHSPPRSSKKGNSTPPTSTPFPTSCWPEAPSLPDAAYRFCRDEPGVHVVLSGTGNAGHLDANLASFARPPLTQETRDRLIHIFPPRQFYHGASDISYRLDPVPWDKALIYCA